MSILPQLERDLLEAADRRLAASGAGGAEPLRARIDGRSLARRLRLPVIALVCLLAAATIALAASGVILTGAPVRPEELLNPDVGEGVPAPGASRLLPLRVPDPEGGLPWGMRIVRTTRGDICMQVGRVQDGQLGVLGVDGAFHDDGRFHPMPADALPADVFHGHVFGGGLANANTSCQLAGEASADYHIGVERSAVANAESSTSPLSSLRDIYYGILGPNAVTVSYRAGKVNRALAVVGRVGAYLIVRRTHRGQQVGTGGGSLGTEGDLSPSPPLTTITYRLAGKLCQRGPSLPPGVTAHLVDPCPWPHWPRSSAATRDLHQPPHVRLQIRAGTITAADVSFVAPFAVTSARAEYVLAIPTAECAGTGSAHRRGHKLARSSGLVEESLARDVRRGALVTSRFDYPFANGCGRRSVTIEVLYAQAGQPRVLVGATTVRAPAGARLKPPQLARRRHQGP